MGNRRNNRFKKQEKSKVKLKSKKKLLKAQNVTDINFKVRKIIMPSQLKAIDNTEIVTRKKQNVKVSLL